MVDQNEDNSSSNLREEWERDREWVRGYTRDFPELDSLSDGVALTNVKNAPIVGDVTLLNGVKQIPKASVQQLPVFSARVNGTKNSIPALFSSFLLREMVFNQDTFGKGILSTIQVGAEAALTRGFQAFMAKVGTVYNGFGSTLQQVHYKDFGVERGIFDFSDSGHYSIRTRITRGRLRKLIKAAEDNPQTTWDIEALKELLDSHESGESLQSDDSAPRSTGNDNASDNRIDIITRYGVGPYYDIEVFSPSVDKVLRSYKSNSKFGYPRMQALVLDPAQLHPFGVSRVRLATPAANYANIYLQSTAKMQLINADPPAFQRGQFLGSARLRRGAVLRSNDPNADVRFLELSNSTLREFRNVLDFVDSQILSVLGVGDGQGTRSNSAYVNKATAEAQNSRRDMSVAQVTAILENFLRQYALTALDLFISEQVGESDVIVDDECKDAINRLGESEFVPSEEMPEYVPIIGKDNKLHITWKELYDSIETWTVDIDLSIGKNELEEKTRADLQDAVTVASQTTDPADAEGVARKRVLENELFKKIAPDIKTGGGDVAQVVQQQQSQMQAGMEG